MTRETRISMCSIADDTDLRSLEIQIGPQKFRTPTTAVITNNFYKDTSFPKDLLDLHEMFLRFDEDSLIKLDQDTGYSVDKNKKLDHSVNKTHSCPKFCLLEFKNNTKNSVESRYPTHQEIDILTNFAYSHSDITPIPSVPKMVRNLHKDNIDDFLTYLNICCETIEVRNKKCILGYIPTTAPLFTRKIVNLYLDKGINAYYIDFDGTMVTSHLDMLNSLKRELAKRGYDENNFLHYVNVTYGKSINDTKVLSARDLLAFGHGLDSLGGIHTSQRRPPEYYEMLKTKKDINRNTNRLLNIDNYGYYIYDTLGNKFETLYPENALINKDLLNTPVKTRLTKLIKIVNLQQQCLEADKLGQIINETPDESLNYFESKRNVLDNDIKLLSKRSAE